MAVLANTYNPFHSFLEQRMLVFYGASTRSGKIMFSARFCSAGTVTLVVDGKEVGKVELKHTVPAAFRASETFDVGVDLGSTVSLTITRSVHFHSTEKFARLRSNSNETEQITAALTLVLPNRR